MYGEEGLEGNGPGGGAGGAMSDTPHEGLEKRRGCSCPSEDAASTGVAHSVFIVAHAWITMLSRSMAQGSLAPQIWQRYRLQWSLPAVVMRHYHSRALGIGNYNLVSQRRRRR